MNDERSSCFFFQHTACPYFPCHPTDQPETFNCLFCYCPLYTLGNACGGDYRILDNDIKDCSACTRCHAKNAADEILTQFDRIHALEKSQRTSKR